MPHTYDEKDLIEALAGQRNAEANSAAAAAAVIARLTREVADLKAQLAASKNKRGHAVS